MNRRRITDNVEKVAVLLNFLLDLQVISFDSLKWEMYISRMKRKI